MTTTQRIIKELHIMGAISEQTALNAKEVAEIADTKQAHARLCELRDQGLVIASSRTGKNKYWLTLAGVEYAEKMEEIKQDQSTDANLSQANNASENSELTDATNQAIPEGFTYWGGGECPVPRNTLIDVIFEDGRTDNNSKALGFQWKHGGVVNNIIAYRLSEPTAETVVVPESENPYNPIYKKWVAGGLIVKFTELTKGEVIEAGASYYEVGHMATFSPHTCKEWQDWTPPEAEATESTKIDPVIVENVEAFNRLNDVKAIELKPTFGDWIDGYPRKPYSSEWCIVKFNNKRGVVLVRELSEENSYDFETADETYLKKELIKCWMPMPDSDLIHPFDYAEDKDKAIELLDRAQIAVNRPLEKRVQYLIESREEDQNFIQKLVKQRKQVEEALQEAQDELANEQRVIPPPHYNPDDVAFKKSDTVFWYTVDGIKEVFETSTDAIHAAQELVKNRKIVATIHAVASKPHAIIKPVVTTELEYL